MNKHTKKRQKIKAVLFDIDGVLLDSFEANLKFFQDILERGGYHKLSRREYAKAFHLPFIDALRYFTRTKLEKELKRLQKLAEEVDYREDLLDFPEDAHDITKELGGRYKLAVVSSRRRRSIARYFAFAQNRRLFNAVVCYEDCVRHKPHPEPLLLAAKRLNLASNECVYVGDAHTDIEAGKAAGMKTILYGKRRNKEADAVTTSFRRLLMVIKGL